ncbi:MULTISPECIES: response regulator [Auritidibacter]|uniref:response regulator n=1 Tax=Auritidibacter TaxID=1160973 RepID=UPI00141B6D08|nr:MULTISPECIES: response regulator transcription factor [Auritidibacter]NIH72452.1 DNA-binding NarL/FixJ family response regulator [Auritidibacter ignavus]WGH81070.1 response regulator transcription factor [Auritidibacter ignavus]WGH85672.1 response regulator transcription factor [Auritidibacter ignavus]WGH87960.1 response regulator transcription factor [Auritidibacter ignavus]WGH90260.1 response regulator transcription factor [Auritidibacter ignavus]
MTTPPAPISIGVIDDQHLVRSGLSMLINSQPDLTVTAEAATGTEALTSEAIAGCDVLLMDIRMPGLNGIEATRRLLAEHPTIRVVVLTTFDLDEYALEAIDAGASGFLLKDAPPDQLLSGIRSVHHGDAVIAPSTTRRLLDHLATELRTPSPATPHCHEELDQAIATLTNRERDVLIQMAEGLSNQEIAEVLFVSETTVKTHVSKILQKLHARDRVQAVVAAYRAGIVPQH